MTIPKLARFIVDDWELWDDKDNPGYLSAVKQMEEKLEDSKQEYYKDYQVPVLVKG